MTRFIELKTSASGQDGITGTRLTLLPLTTKTKPKIEKMVETTIFKTLDIKQQRTVPETWKAHQVDPVTAHVLPC